MLPRFPVVAEPNLFQRRVEAEVVYVPVGMFGGAHVVSQPSPDASRPECAADIDVEPRLESQVAQPPDPDYSIRRRRQQESVSAGAWFEVGWRPHIRCNEPTRPLVSR